jgi:hypothetical protein
MELSAVSTSLLASILDHRDAVERCSIILEYMLLPSKPDLRVRMIGIALESSAGYVPDLNVCLLATYCILPSLFQPLVCSITLRLNVVYPIMSLDHLSTTS